MQSVVNGKHYSLKRRPMKASDYTMMELNVFHHFVKNKLSYASLVLSFSKCKEKHKIIFLLQTLKCVILKGEPLSMF